MDVVEQGDGHHRRDVLTGYACPMTMLTGDQSTTIWES